MCDDKHIKKKGSISTRLKGPSSTRLAAQRQIDNKKRGLSVDVRLTCLYRLFQPNVQVHIEKSDATDYDTDTTVNYELPPTIETMPPKLNIKPKVEPK